MAEGQLGEVPTWIQYLIGAIALVITGVATRLGYAKQKSDVPQHVEIAGGIIDNKGVRALVEALEETTDRFHDIHRERLHISKDFKEEINSLSQDIRELTRQVSLLVERMR